MTDVISVTPAGKQKLVNIVPWGKETFQVDASDTESSLDIGSGADFVKYIVLAERISGGTEAKAFEMNVHDIGGSPLDTISNIIGVMNLTVDSVVDGNGIHIDITNNEVYNINITITYTSN